MRTFFRFIVAFLAITGAVTLAAAYGDLNFSKADFWNHHSWIFLFCIAAFPRLTLLFGGIAWGGWIWWLSWLFVPRILVAFLATLAYWHSNPILVVFAWLTAVGGESGEKAAVRSRRKPRRNESKKETKRSN